MLFGLARCELADQVQLLQLLWSGVKHSVAGTAAKPIPWRANATRRSGTKRRPAASEINADALLNTEAWCNARDADGGTPGCHGTWDKKQMI